MTRDSSSSLVARRRAYALLGALLVEGLDEERVLAVRELPALAERLPADVDLEELAAEHYAQLGHELLPFAGVYLGEDGLVGGGAVTTVLRSAHAVVGAACPDDPSPDHLGQVLRLMAVFVDAEIDARRHGDMADVRTLGHWQRRVLDEALLPWMPPLHAALAEQPPSLWTRVIEMAIGVSAQQRASDPSLPCLVGGLGHEESLDALLSSRRTGLVAVAKVLTTPVRCGFYLARRDLEALARRCELPRGFGSRRSMLEKLLRGAAEYGAIPRVVEQFNRLLATRDDAHVALGREPGLAVHVPAWRRRVATTRRLLARLGDAVARPAPEGAGSDAPEAERAATMAPG